MSKKRGPKFYQTEEFKRLYSIWVTGKNSIISTSGFNDIEYPNGSLKTKNKRTQSYRQQENIARISSALISYIENPSVKLISFEKRILELHSQGIYNKEIIRITGKSHQTVWKTIKKHIPLALGLYAQEEAEAHEVDLLHHTVEITVLKEFREYDFLERS